MRLHQKRNWKTQESLAYGYVIVNADNRKNAIQKFRSQYPDRHHGYINCSSVYTEDQWKVVTKRVNMGRLYKTIL